MKKICDLHGEFELKQIDWPLCETGKKWIGRCPDCVDQEEKIKKSKDLAEKEKRYRERRLAAGISERNLSKTFDDYNSEDGTKEDLAKKKFMAYAESILRGEHPGNLICSGSVGTGKTLLSCALIDVLIERKSCKLIKLYDLMAEIKKTYNGDSGLTEADIINRFANYDLLIIDEIGTQTDTDWEKLQIFNVIDGRYQKLKPTILVSNLQAEEIQKVIGERSVDRLREERAVVIPFDWKSKRGNKVIN